jgi:hypothetical protein
MGTPAQIVTSLSVSTIGAITVTVREMVSTALHVIGFCAVKVIVYVPGELKV